MEREFRLKTQGSGTNQVRKSVAPQFRIVLMKMAKNVRKNEEKTVLSSSGMASILAAMVNL